MIVDHNGQLLGRGQLQRVHVRAGGCSPGRPHLPRLRGLLEPDGFRTSGQNQKLEDSPESRLPVFQYHQTVW